MNKGLRTQTALPNPNHANSWMEEQKHGTPSHRRTALQKLHGGHDYAQSASACTSALDSEHIQATNDHKKSSKAGLGIHMLVTSAEMQQHTETITPPCAPTQESRTDFSAQITPLTTADLTIRKHQFADPHIPTSSANSAQAAQSVNATDYGLDKVILHEHDGYILEADR